jgi:hypothetical protein
VLGCCLQVLTVLLRQALPVRPPRLLPLLLLLVERGVPRHRTGVLVLPQSAAPLRCGGLWLM